MFLALMYLLQNVRLARRGNTTTSCGGQKTLRWRLVRRRENAAAALVLALAVAVSSVLAVALAVSVVALAVVLA